MKEGDSIVQLVLKCIQTRNTTTVAILLETDRGDNGFGSIGIAIITVNEVVLDRS